MFAKNFILELETKNSSQAKSFENIFDKRQHAKDPKYFKRNRNLQKKLFNSSIDLATNSIKSTAQKRFREKQLVSRENRDGLDHCLINILLRFPLTFLFGSSGKQQKRRMTVERHQKKNRLSCTFLLIGISATDPDLYFRQNNN